MYLKIQPQIYQVKRGRNAERTYKLTIVFGDLNTAFSETDRSCREKKVKY